jgi:hypothetical protein
MSKHFGFKLLDWEKHAEFIKSFAGSASGFLTVKNNGRVSFLLDFMKSCPNDIVCLRFGQM